MKNKKTYISPIIESFQIDQEISLVMMTSNPIVGWDINDSNDIDRSGPQFPSTLSSDSPFGGTTPDYDNL